MGKGVVDKYGRQETGVGVLVGRTSRYFTRVNRATRRKHQVLLCSAVGALSTAAAAVIDAWILLLSYTAVDWYWCTAQRN